MASLGTYRLERPSDPRLSGTMTRGARPDARWSAAAVVIIAALFAFITYPKIFLGASDIGELMLGTPDEHLLASGIHRMYIERTLEYGIPVYGGFYPNLALLLLKVSFRIVGATATELSIIVGLRAFSLVFGVLTIVALAHLSWLVSRRPIAPILTAACLACTPEYVYWSIRIHPDTLLLLLVTLTQTCMLMAVRRRSLGWLGGAFILSVCATMTKLVGMFFLPWLFLILVYLEAPWRRGALALRRIAWQTLKSAVWFVFIAYATTPTLLVNSPVFFNGIKRQMAENAAAHAESTPTFGWLSVLLDSDLVGPVALVCFLVMLAALVPPLLSVLRAGSSRLDDLQGDELSVVAPLLFPVGYIGYLLVTTRFYEVRYAMPALPSFALAVGWVAAVGWSKIEWLRSRRWSSMAVPALVVTAMVVLEGAERKTAIQGDFRWLHAREQDPRLEAGRWLAKTAPPDSVIIFDYGVYVPYQFKNAHKTFGLLERQVIGHHPDYVLLLDSRRNAFDCGDPRFVEICETLNQLDARQLHGYTPTQRFARAGITVYTSTVPRP